MKFAITFGTLSPKYWLEAAIKADECGFESVWLPEHLVLPIEMAGSPYADTDHPPVPPETQIYDVISFLSYVAAKTENIKLGTYVYLLGLRHPFITARGWATLDLMSNGRAILGAGAGWLESEWRAVDIDPKVRGARLDEAIDVCRKLWSEPVVKADGDHFKFDPVAFEPKPIQQPIPIHIGGEGPLALRRAARLGDGWLGMGHSHKSATAIASQLRAGLIENGRKDVPFEVTVAGACEKPNDLKAWEEAGVDRLIVRPWEKSKDAKNAIEEFASLFSL